MYMQYRLAAVVNIVAAKIAISRIFTPGRSRVPKMRWTGATIRIASVTTNAVYDTDKLIMRTHVNGVYALMD